MSIIFSLLGTKDRFDFEKGILFLEDLSEQLYHLDRMFFALKKGGCIYVATDIEEYAKEMIKNEEIHSLTVEKMLRDYE